LKFSLLLFRYSIFIFIRAYSFLKLNKTIILELSLFDLSTSNFSFILIFDKIRVRFRIVVTLISGRVFLFAHKYIEEDPFSNRFIWILLSFVISINLLIFSGSIFFLLLGWDGLGITSFALIVYYERKESQIAGFQTLIINRLGDVIIVISIFLFSTESQFSYISMTDNIFYSSGIVIIFCIAALTKRAQFPFRSWLPAAMAAPTPVRALVHSSTLVTAGIFIIIRLRYTLPLDQRIRSILLFCGSVTCLLGGWAATYENDIKKIIALSTLSQLGVIVFSLGINLPALSLFHLYTHALFKALLFLAAGHILIVTFGVQDIRKIGGVGVIMPLTCVMFNVRSLCLVGAPFIRAFYSKHLILEKIFISPINISSVFLIIIGTIITAKYVFRTLKSISWDKRGMPLLRRCSSLYTSLPVCILSVGAIIGGKLVLSLEISNFELAFLPSLESALINVVTVIGLVLGLAQSRSSRSRITLSTLFFLTPLIYGRVKPFGFLIDKIKILDNGWVEPYFFVTNSVYIWGSTLSQEGSWPGSRWLVTSFITIFLILSGGLFIN